LVDRGLAAFNDHVELLPREEVALLLGSLTACGFLVLGILDVLWPSTFGRRASPRASKTPATPAAPPAAVTPPAPSEAPRPLPPPPSALNMGRLLLERARAEADLERRVTILTRAVAGLTRSTQSTPDDHELAATLATTRALLWQTWEQIALARLAAAMPWDATAPATAAPQLGARSEPAGHAGLPGSAVAVAG
jgi:hypothetical protein